MIRTGGALLTGAFLAFSAACGSTVPLQEQTAAQAGVGSGSRPGSYVPDSGLGATSGGGGSASAAGSTTGESGVQRPLGAAASAQAGSNQPNSSIPVASVPGTGKSRAIPASGRGWTRSTVAIGVITNKDLSTFAGTIGVNTLDAGDSQADSEAMIKRLNAEGGLFGRKVTALYYDVKTTDNKESAAQATCTYFTQDHPVIAVIAGAVESDTPTFRACMAASHVAVLAGGTQPFDDRVFNDLKGQYMLLSLPSWNTLAPPLVRSLVAQGYFHGWDTSSGKPSSSPVRIGLLGFDSAIQHRVNAVLAAELTRAGYKPYESYFYANQSSISGAVLRFRADGVTHVISTDQFLFLFMNTADNQQYQPRYGISTPNAPGLLLQGTAPARQLVGSLGVGFLPMLDVDAGHDAPTGPPGWAQCKADLAKGGVTYSSQKRFAIAVAGITCDAYNLIARGVVQGGGLSETSVLQGVKSIAASVPSAFTFRNGLSPQQLTRPGAAAPLRYDSSCSCYRYAGPVTGFS